MPLDISRAVSSIPTETRCSSFPTGGQQQQVQQQQPAYQQPVQQAQPSPQPVMQQQAPQQPVSQNQQQDTFKPKISLAKGQKINLDKQMTMGKAFAGLGWDINKYDTGSDFDLDVSIFLLGENGKVNNDKDVIFYNNLKGRNDCVVHTGDNRTGAGDGFDEIIYIDFTKIPDDVQKIVITATIFQAVERNQNFGQVQTAFIRVAKMENDKPVFDDSTISFELGEDFSIETALSVCEIYKYNGQWKFNALGSGYQGGLKSIMESFGLAVE